MTAEVPQPPQGAWGVLGVAHRRSWKGVLATTGMVSVHQVCEASTPVVAHSLWSDPEVEHRAAGTTLPISSSDASVMGWSVDSVASAVSGPWHGACSATPPWW